MGLSPQVSCEISRKGFCTQECCEHWGWTHLPRFSESSYAHLNPTHSGEISVWRSTSVDSGTRLRTHKNQVSFEVHSHAGEDEVSLKVYPFHIEVYFFPSLDEEHQLSFGEVCNNVRLAVVSFLLKSLVPFYYLCCWPLPHDSGYAILGWNRGYIYYHLMLIVNLETES
jgi:hypothetical protein